MAPEGLENNEVIYELVADGGWTEEPIQLDRWLSDYTACRYGQLTMAMETYWQNISHSVYGSFTDHPRFNWQLRPGIATKGTVCMNDSLFMAIEAFATNAPILGHSALYQADLAELMALYAGAKMEILTRKITKAYNEGDPDTGMALERSFTDIALTVDSLLDSHPTLRLDRWIGFATAAARGNHSLALQYERNAKRVVTIWGPPVDDYSARIWSGLIRSYYLPRWQYYFQVLRTRQPFDFKEWEQNWVETSANIGARRPVKDVIHTGIRLLRQCRSITE